MLNRYYVPVAFLLASLALGITMPTFADDASQPTAVELFQQGMTAYQQGHLKQAQTILRKVDPAQIPNKAERIKYFDTLRAVDQKLNATQSAKSTNTSPVQQPKKTAPVQRSQPAQPAEPAQSVPQSSSDTQLLDQANHISAYNPSKAEKLYQQVIDSSTASQAVKQKAVAQLAELKRELHPGLTIAREKIDAAQRDIQDGNFDAAASKLQDVKNSGIDLGWFDQQRYNRELAVLNQHQAGMAVQVANQGNTGQQSKPQMTPAGNGESNQLTAAVQPESPARTQVSPPPSATTKDLLEQFRQTRLEQRLNEAAQAKNKAQYSLAARRYQQALDLDPGNKQAAQGLAVVNAALAQKNQSNHGAQFLEERETQRQIQIQAAEAEYSQAMDSAKKKLTAGNFAAATESVHNAKFVLDANRRILPEDEYKSLRDKAEQVASAIADKQHEVEIAKQKTMAASREKEVQQKQRNAQAQQQKEVQGLVQRALTLQRDMKYDQALQVISRAIDRDPTNFAAQAIKQSIENAQIAVKSREYQRREFLETAKQQLADQEALIPYSSPIIYPADWPQLTKERLQEKAKNSGSAKNLAIEQALSKDISINFQGAKFSKVIDYIRQVTGQNIYVNWAQMNSAGVQKDSQISLKLNNIPASRALSLIIQQAAGSSPVEPVGYSIIDGIITISTERELNNATDIRTYDIRDLLQYVPSVVKPPSFSLTNVLSGNSSNGGTGTGGGATTGGVGGGGGGAGLFGGTSSNSTTSGNSSEEKKKYRSDMIKTVTDLITSTVGKPGDWSGGASSLKQINGELVIRTTPQNHQQITKLLASIRQDRGIQISVEARFLFVSNDFLNDIGTKLDININAGGGFGSSPIKIAQDSVSMVNQPESTPYTTFSTTGQLDPGTFAAGSGFATGANEALNMGLGYALSDLQVNLLVRASQADQKSLTVTAPRVTFLNGHEAYVMVAEQQAFVSSLTPIPNSIGYQPTISVLQKGALLDVSGTVSADRRYVTLSLSPQLATGSISSFDFSSSALTTGGNNNSNVSGSSTGTIQEPDIKLYQISTTVSVPDRGTLLLGGQRHVASIEKQAGVPVLSRIPIISRFFANQTTTKSEQTLIILVKPTIIIHSEEEDKRFPGLSENPYNYNVSHTYNNGIGE